MPLLTVVPFLSDALPHILKDQVTSPLISLNSPFIILCSDLLFKASNIWKVDLGYLQIQKHACIVTLTHRCPTRAHVFHNWYQSSISVACKRIGIGVSSTSSQLCGHGKLLKLSEPQFLNQESGDKEYCVYISWCVCED